MKAKTWKRKKRTYCGNIDNVTPSSSSPFVAVVDHLSVWMGRAAMLFLLLVISTHHGWNELGDRAIYSSVALLRVMIYFLVLANALLLFFLIFIDSVICLGVGWGKKGVGWLCLSYGRWLRKKTANQVSFWILTRSLKSPKEQQQARGASVVSQCTVARS